jgi:hypothetical protein
MRRVKIDGIVEAVRYRKNGEIDWVRAFERRGPTYSDWILLDRPTLIERLKAGKNFVAGKRLPYMASTFETSLPIRLLQSNGRDIVVSGDTEKNQDHLEGVPVI